MNEAVLQKSAMKCLIDNFGNVEAERFISLIIKEPFDYTKWQEPLYEDMSIVELSEKAMKNRLAKKKMQAKE
ncbi:hypothetical protein REC12_01320 [Desulfosporosinus sp. PR]|uniref:hypothetical protein n=1 Tax=Candidatus Desulfosporosinus nitrosoreducens TaxID=3401928 RepID=UPI0027E9E19A|nr:hypothetical protein [Desulfosporosinus sp. PR]MDQ7092230.1 hypothetical protein [Desulfosporosinus sp. PR]